MFVCLCMENKTDILIMVADVTTTNDDPGENNLQELTFNTNLMLTICIQ